MKNKQRFIADKMANLGVGLVVGSFLLRISDTISLREQILLVLLGFLNILLGLILLPDE